MSTISFGAVYKKPGAISAIKILPSAGGRYGVAEFMGRSSLKKPALVTGERRRARNASATPCPYLQRQCAPPVPAASSPCKQNGALQTNGAAAGTECRCHGLKA
jgi:hypothetical protein